MEDRKTITVIGSRSAPQDILDAAVTACAYMLMNHHNLRSGAAGGMDKTVEIASAQNASQGIEQAQPTVYLPWGSFNSDTRAEGVKYLVTGSDQEAERIASQIHPAWDRCSQGVKKLHTRNVHQILGEDCETPSDIVLYWCNEDAQGNPTGGTATAVNLARSHGITTINMIRPEWRMELWYALRQPCY